MNVTYKCNKGNAFICADGVQKMMASYEDVEELLICENLIELLKYFHHRDKKELIRLNSKKDTLDKAAVATGAYAVTSSIVVPLLSSCDVVSSGFAAGFSLGVLSTGAAVCVLNKYVLPHNKVRRGIRACLRYQEYKIDELNDRIDEIRKNSSVIEGDVSETLIDDREDKKRIQDVLNFVYYMGGNKEKVYEMYLDITLQKFLREKMKITDLKTINEIEKYVYFVFIDRIQKDKTYTLK